MKILITRHDKIGDFVTMLPVCKVLKEQTDHTIVMLVAKVNIALAKELEFIDDVIEYTDDSKALIETIKAHKFDVSISGYIDNAKLEIETVLSGAINDAAVQVTNLVDAAKTSVINAVNNASSGWNCSVCQSGCTLWPRAINNEPRED